jgi:pSer/pThr/pTyr-binding forkhead associated (FHA) protein
MPQNDSLLTPELIIEMLLEEMEAGVCPTFYSNLVPSVFEIYLSADDLERFRPLERRMRDEAVRALSQKLSGLNRALEPKLKLPLSSNKKKSKSYEALGEWSIEFFENIDDDAKENPLTIHSSFPSTNEEDDRVGVLTERVTRRRTDGQSITTSTQRTGNVETNRASGIVFAILEYEDETGRHNYQMTKDVLKIGRASEDHWADLKLKAQKDVSREHARIRRDPATGRLFIKDLSTLGTTVDGKRLPSSNHRSGGDLDTTDEVPLPNKARIGLAGVLFIDFRVVKQK